MRDKLLSKVDAQSNKGDSGYSSSATSPEFRHETLRLRSFLNYMYLFSMATTLTQSVLALILKDGSSFRLFLIFMLCNAIGYGLIRFHYLYLSVAMYLAANYLLNLHQTLVWGIKPEFAVQFFALFTLSLCLHIARSYKIFIGMGIYVTLLVVLLKERLAPGAFPVQDPLLQIANTFMNMSIGFFMVFFTLYCFMMLTEKSENDLRSQANTDSLTGLLNRRALNRFLEQAYDTCNEEKKPLCALLLDLDFFKTVNDTHGHPAGDVVLRNVAAILQASVRKDDAVGRFGGEEFLILLPNCPAGRAIPIAERIRQQIAETPMLLPSGQSISITVSLGVAELGAGQAPSDLLANTDSLLYKAKQNGRNRVEHA